MKGASASQVIPGNDNLPSVDDDSLDCGDLRMWFRADYLLWWVRGASLPPLVTSSPPGTSIANAGVIGTPGTVVLFGDDRVNDDLRSGGRITAGWWLDACQHTGVEASFFMLESKAKNFVASSAGVPILGRPFVDATTGQPAAERVAFPGDVAGSLDASATSGSLLGAGAWLRCNLCRGCWWRLDGLAGYRYLRLSDRVDVFERLVSTNPDNPNGVPFGTQIGLEDHFATANNFHGFDTGLEGEVRCGGLALQVLGKLAVGGTFETADIQGNTTVAFPGSSPAVSPGGLLAVASNSGHHTGGAFSFVPELGVRLGYLLGPDCRLSVGYSLLFWTDVVRAGDQVDLAVNPGLIPPVTHPVGGPQRPAFEFQRTTIWAQGVDLGLEFRF
jgi:hypothetical protein